MKKEIKKKAVLITYCYLFLYFYMIVTVFKKCFEP